MKRISKYHDNFEKLNTSNNYNLYHLEKDKDKDTPFSDHPDLVRPTSSTNFRIQKKIHSTGHRDHPVFSNININIKSNKYVPYSNNDK